jgi:hypothetical protein
VGAGTGVVGINSAGAGHGVEGLAGHAGYGVYGVKLAGGTGDAVHGDAFTSGAGVSGTSTSGRGGQFQGAAAAIRLVPTTASSHPTPGQAGDLVVDSSGRLWFCKKTGNPGTWTQLA